ncbi:MAG: hypothetical protein COW13_01440, partial [Candidatus Omnitrophica bacterium CG12_big_fil_rev_8_21_14_0_65_50_5]
MPPDKSPKLYDLKKTAFWFFVAAMLLFISLTAMILQDSIRQWKGWQRKFMAYKKEQVETKLTDARKHLDTAKITELKADLEKAGQDLASKRGEIRKAEEELGEIKLAYTTRNMEYQTLKQFQDSDRYFLEEAGKHGEAEKASEYTRAMEERGGKLAALKQELEQLEFRRDAKQGEVDGFSGHEKELSKEMTRLTQEVDLLENQEEKLTPNLVSAILNAPMLDFLKPT